MSDDEPRGTRAPCAPAREHAPWPTRGEVPHEEARALRVGFGTLVWSLRTHAGLTQAHLAQRAGLPEWTIRELEHGRVRPSEDTCATLAVALHPHADPIAVAVAVADLNLQAAAGPSLHVRPARTRRPRTATQRRRQRREREAALVGAMVLQLIESTPANPPDCARRPARRTERIAPGGSDPRRVLPLAGGAPGQRPAS